MKLIAENYRPFGQTGLLVPPIVFGTKALGNATQSIPQKTKTEICCEWFKHVPTPVVVDTTDLDCTKSAFSTIAATLHRLEITANEIIVIHRLRFPCSSYEDALNSPTILERCEGVSRLLGNKSLPQFVAIDCPDEYLSRAKSLAVRDSRFQEVLDVYRVLINWKAQGRMIGVGAASANWRILQEIDSQVPLDWVMLLGCLTILSHPTELLDFMHNLSQRQIAIISTNVFQGGFLVGGNNCDNRTLNVEKDEDKSLISWRKSFVALCQGHGVSPAQASIQFALHAPGVVAVAVNTSHPDRIGENVGYAVTKPSDNFWASMKEEGLIAADFPYAR